MDLVNVGRQTQNELYTETVIQNGEALKDVECEITQEDLTRLGVSLAPHNDSILPNEVLSHIFILLAFGYGTVKFPIRKNDAPPQLIISHMCSHWRRVALGTTELWSDTCLIYPPDGSHLIGLHQQWLSRARTLPVTLSLRFLDGDKLVSTLQSILLRIQVKRLSLRLTYDQFKVLATLPEATVSGLSKLELKILFPHDNVNVNTNNPHPLVTRLRSITFRFCKPGHKACIDSLPPNLPWSQLQSLDFCTYTDDLDLTFGVLRQTAMLEELNLSIPSWGVSQQLTMSSLHTFTMDLQPDVLSNHTDQILRCFICPSLTKLSFSAIDDRWTETNKILKQQYNMQELREVGLGNLKLPLSSFLCDVPMLRSLLLAWSSHDIIVGKAAAQDNGLSE
jgi:hypothetical protein